MNAIVLDGHTLNPGDLDWNSLNELMPCTIYPRTAPEEIVSRCQGATAVLTNKVPFSRETLEQLPDLKYIGILATGYNIIDIKAAQEKNIIVSNVPGYSTQSVAQLVFALILENCHHVGLHSQLVHEGAWAESEDFSFSKRPLISLSGLTMGIIGFGAIGKAVAQLACAFGMKVLVSTRSPQSHSEPAVQFTDLTTVFQKSDVVSIHCPLTPETHHLVNEKRLTEMKSTAFLINTGRGPLVDEAALADALQNKKIAGAGLDVLSSEPPSSSNPLWGLDNCYITPHFAWATSSARKRLMHEAIQNLKNFINGNPSHSVT